MTDTKPKPDARQKARCRIHHLQALTFTRAEALIRDKAQLMLMGIPFVCGFLIVKDGKSQLKMHDRQTQRLGSAKLAFQQIGDS